MEAIVRKLSRLLKKEFPGCELELELVGPSRVSGFLIWDGFGRMEQIKRQRIVWKLLRDKLPDNQQAQIAGVLTMTPEEMEVARAG